MFFFLLNQSSIWCFFKSLKTATALSFCFWSPCRRVTATTFIKNSLMIAPCSCFFDTLYTQRANFNSAIPPIVQTALTAWNVLIRLGRSNSHAVNTCHNSRLHLPICFQFLLFSSSPDFQLLFWFETKQTAFPAGAAMTYEKKKPNPPPKQ